MNDSITAEVNRASEICSKQLAYFIEYVQNLDPELKGYEAIMVAAFILNQLPDAFANNPEMLADLKSECQSIKARRK